jgi:CRISPR/Cas system CMR-associated protein Cmr3 (group 5 of RAMP superfamily)
MLERAILQFGGREYISAFETIDSISSFLSKKKEQKEGWILIGQVGMMLI